MRRIDFTSAVSAVVCSFAAAALLGNKPLHAAELVVLAPVMAGKVAVTKAGPKGGADAPVVRRATNALAQALIKEGARGTVKVMLELDERAQRIVGSAKPTPTYLFLSAEEGGFARRGFWLTGADNKLSWRDDPYVDMSVDKRLLDDGGFEEEFAHEMGHVLLRRLLPTLPNGMSRTPHSSLAITDYPTAFDEGFAIHFQGLARHLTQNSALKALDKGFKFKPFLPYWQSDLDRALRVRGMRENLFVQQQLPVALQVGDATALHDLTHFKNGQQMMSSEGVIATLFYHLMVDPTDDAVKRLDRYNALLTSIRGFNSQKVGADVPIFLSLVRVHVQRLPAERTRWYETVLGLTYGATASTSVLKEMTSLSALGQEGRTEEFSAALKKSRAALSELTAQVVRSPQRLNSAVGPELWIAIKKDDGTDVTINLNTAEKTTLMNALGFEPLDADLLLSDRWSRGPFKDVDDFVTRRKASTTLRQRLIAGQALAATIGGYQRE